MTLTTLGVGTQLICNCSKGSTTILNFQQTTHRSTSHTDGAIIRTPWFPPAYGPCNLANNLSKLCLTPGARQLPSPRSTKETQPKTSQRPPHYTPMPLDSQPLRSHSCPIHNTGSGTWPEASRQLKRPATTRAQAQTQCNSAPSWPF